MGGSSNTSCGNGGQLCQDCIAAGGSCSNKACILQPPCGQQSCDGCCQNGNCVLGLSDQACGKDGVNCKNCSNQGQACLDGFCVQ